LDHRDDVGKASGLDEERVFPGKPLEEIYAVVRRKPSHLNPVPVSHVLVDKPAEPPLRGAKFLSVTADDARVDLVGTVAGKLLEVAGSKRTHPALYRPTKRRRLTTSGWPLICSMSLISEMLRLSQSTRRLIAVAMGAGYTRSIQS
jgi:hypothetical protein